MSRRSGWARPPGGTGRAAATDTLGLLLTVLVTSAAVHDSTAGTHLLDHIATHHPRASKAWADSGYKNAVKSDSGRIPEPYDASVGYALAAAFGTGAEPMWKLTLNAALDLWP